MIFGEVAEWFRRKPAKLDMMVRFHPSSPLISEVEGAQMSSCFFILLLIHYPVGRPWL